MAALIRLLAAALLAMPGAALAQAAPDVQVKAAFLYKFGGFVEWPPASFAGPEEAFAIGVLGADEIAAELEGVAKGRTVQERPVLVRRLRRGEPLGRLHILFIGEAEGARLQQIAAAAQGQPILIVTETENSTSRGSMINFVEVDRKVRFDVALAPAERDHLRISARLLSVARRVLPRS